MSNTKHKKTDDLNTKFGKHSRRTTSTNKVTCHQCLQDKKLGEVVTDNFQYLCMECSKADNSE